MAQGDGMEQQMRYLALIERRELQKKNLCEAALREADRLSALLKKEFEYEALYLIGSVVKERGFHYQSDIDFVIKGLKRESFFKAFALLIKNSSFEVDLKPWEELSADSKAREWKRRGEFFDEKDAN